MANVNGRQIMEFQPSEGDIVTVGKALDANRYATKKTIAQGMLDIALLTANASQLKYVLMLGQKHDFYQIMVALLASSIVLQVVVGILFLVVGALDINKQSNQRLADILNDLLVLLIFILSVINIVISTFGIQHADLMTPHNRSNCTTLTLPGK